MLFLDGGESKAPDYQGDIWRLLLATPKLLVLLGCSFLSGHLWLYLIYGHYIKKKGTDSGKKLLDTIWGKVSMGAVWLAIFLYIVHIIKNKSLSIEGGNQILGATYEAVFLGAFIQFIILIITIFVGHRKSQQNNV